MSGVTSPAPWRIAFDNARDPYTARNALGAETLGAGGGGGGGAPPDAEYIVAATDATLTNERVLTNTATITWDFTTPGQAKASTAAGGGNVSNSGTPTVGQYAKWVTATTIQGVNAATVLGDIGAQPAGSYQPLDADLTAIAALAGTNTIYYRSGVDTWSPVVVSTGLAFSGGNLTATGGGGTPGGSTTQVQYNNAGAFGGAANLTWNNGTSVLTLTGQLAVSVGSATSVLAAGTVEGASFRCAGGVAVLGPTTAGVVALRPNGIASTTGQMTVSSTGAVTVNGTIELGAATDTTLSRVSAGTVAIEGQNILTAATGQPLDADLTAIAALTGTNTIYYRSAADTWSPVVVSTGLSFSGGNLTATGGGGGDVFLANSNPFTGALNTFMGADVVFGHTAALDTGARVEINGTTNSTAGASLARWSADALPAVFNLRKSRGASVGTAGLVSADDMLGAIDFYANNGAAFNRGARITASADASLFSSNVPGRLSFWTVGPTSGDGEVERARIDNAGALTVGLTTQYAKFGPAGGNIKGVTDGSNAAAGYVGEYIEAVGGSIGVAAGSTTAVVSMAFSAGDWDVWGCASFSSATTGSRFLLSQSATTAIDTAAGRYVSNVVTPNGDCISATPTMRQSLTATTTLYMVAFCQNAGTINNSKIMARRVR